MRAGVGVVGVMVEVVETQEECSQEGEEVEWQAEVLDPAAGLVQAKKAHAQEVRKGQILEAEAAVAWV